MYIYFSMILLTALCGLLSKGSEIPCSLEGRVEKRTNYFFAFITMAYIAFFLGMLDGCFDLSAYESYYRTLPTEPSQIPEYMETVKKYPGFYGFQILFKTYISDKFLHFHLFQVSFDFLALMYLYRKYSCNFAFSMFLFLASGRFIWPVNGVKQFFAACIIIAFSKFLMEKKFLRFALGVLIASTFHTSALVVLPAYFFVHGKPWNKKMLLILAGSILAITFLSTFTNVLEFLLESTEYDASNIIGGSSGANILHLLIAAVPAVIALIARKRIEETAPKYINVCINMSLISACIYFVSSFTTGVYMGRMPIYFELYSFISLPWLLENAFDKETSKTMKIACVICYIILYFLIRWKLPYTSHTLNIYILP